MPNPQNEEMFSPIPANAAPRLPTWQDYVNEKRTALNILVNTLKDFRHINNLIRHKARIDAVIQSITQNIENYKALFNSHDDIESYYATLQPIENLLDEFKKLSFLFTDGIIMRLIPNKKINETYKKQYSMIATNLYQLKDALSSNLLNQYDDVTCDQYLTETIKILSEIKVEELDREKVNADRILKIINFISEKNDSHKKHLNSYVSFFKKHSKIYCSEKDFKDSIKLIHIKLKMKLEFYIASFKSLSRTITPNDINDFNKIRSIITQTINAINEIQSFPSALKDGDTSFEGKISQMKDVLFKIQLIIKNINLIQKELNTFCSNKPNPPQETQQSIRP